jgi:uncharacterized protein YdhG (YjbR/CyaY superfamily)
MLTIEEYLALLTPGQLAQFERVRRAVRDVVPDADLSISYGMPTFKLKGQRLIYFGAFKKHMTIFPGTIKFTEKAPLSDDRLREIVLDRLIEISKGTS